MDEETYREHFEVSEQEIAEKWAVIQSIFKLPRVGERFDWGAWPRFPAPIFDQSCKLAFLEPYPLTSESDFRLFRKVLEEVGDDAFLVLILMSRAYEGRPYRLLSFPSDVAWTTFNDDRQEWVLPGLNHYVVGSGGRWGMFFYEPYNVYLLAYKDEPALRAFQHAYSFRGRGAEIMDPLSKSSRAGRRLHEIADEIHAQETEDNRS